MGLSAHAGFMNTAWKAIKNDFAARRATAARRRLLETELASYTTPAQIEDLLTAADRSTDGDTELLRSVLSDNLSRYYARQRIVA